MMQLFMLALKTPRNLKKCVFSFLASEKQEEEKFQNKRKKNGKKNLFINRNSGCRIVA